MRGHSVRAAAGLSCASSAGCEGRALHSVWAAWLTCKPSVGAGWSGRGVGCLLQRRCGQREGCKVCSGSCAFSRAGCAF